MNVVNNFDENYGDPTSAVRRHEHAMGWNTEKTEQAWPGGSREFLSKIVSDDVNATDGDTILHLRQH